MSDDGPLTLTLPDGHRLSVASGTTAGEALRQWDPTRAADSLAALWQGHPDDLVTPLRENGAHAPLSFLDRAGREILQHSAAHLVAKGLVETIPEARPTVGPPTEEGFYYDFDVRPLTPADLDAMRTAMERSVKAREPFRRREMPRGEAERLFAKNPYKLRYIAEVPPGEPISVYDTGSFTELCRGAHVPDSGWLDCFLILGFSAISPV